ncbi:TubC N-terminal docking domain-related protein [Rhodanobacter lindaniclasticus]
MNATPLLRELQAAGVTLSATGDRLHVQAPAGIVTPALRQRIAENKAGLLTELHRPHDTTTDDTRADLLALADRLAVDRTHVHRLDDDGLALLAAVGGGGMRAFLLAAEDAATRQAGRVPLDDTAAIYCQHCGPVYVHPAIAAALPVVNGWPRALGCPWCFVRKVGGYIPRPRVACEGCRHFTPDTLNPPAGMGTCGAGKGMHYPMQHHGCGDYRPKGTDHD